MPIPYYTRAEIDMMFGKDPSEVRIYFYTDASPKPVEGEDNVLYVDKSNYKAEVWDIDTSTYEIITGEDTIITYQTIIDALGFTPADVEDLNNYYTKTELDAIHQTFLTEETDPVFTASPAHSITEINKTNWSEAFSKMVSAISVTGDANKILTITFQDSTTLTASFTDMAGVADGDEYVNSLNFNTTDGVLTVGRTGTLTDITVSLDGRYLTSIPTHTHTWSEITGVPAFILDAPNDGKPYSRQNLTWVEAPSKPRLMNILSNMLYDNPDNYASSIYGVSNDLSNLETIATSAYYDNVVIFRADTGSGINWKIAVHDNYNFDADKISINFREVDISDDYSFGKGYLIASRINFESQQGSYKVYDAGGNHFGDLQNYTTTTDLVYTFDRKENVLGASDIEWENILNKPTEFNPSAHTHAWSEITGKPALITSAAFSGLDRKTLTLTKDDDTTITAFFDPVIETVLPTGATYPSFGLREGANTFTSGEDNVNMGYFSTIAGSNNFLAGSSHQVTGGGHTVTGAGNTVLGSNHFVTGNQNQVTAGTFNTLVAGAYNTSRTMYTAIFGYNNQDNHPINEGTMPNPDGGNLIAGWNNNISSGMAIGMFGSGHIQTGNNLVVVGQNSINLNGAQYAVNTPTDARFIVGNGNIVPQTYVRGNAPSNAFVVYHSGLVVAPTLTPTLIDTQDRSLITKEYLTTALEGVGGGTPDPTRFAVTGEDDEATGERYFYSNDNDFTIDGVKYYKIKGNVFGATTEFNLENEAGYSYQRMFTESGAAGTTTNHPSRNTITVRSIGGDREQSFINLTSYYRENELTTGGEVFSEESSLIFRNNLFALTKKRTENHVEVSSNTYNIPLSINGIFADVNGNIEVPIDSGGGHKNINRVIEIPKSALTSEDEAGIAEYLNNLNPPIINTEGKNLYFKLVDEQNYELETANILTSFDIDDINSFDPNISTSKYKGINGGHPTGTDGYIWSHNYNSADKVITFNSGVTFAMFDGRPAIDISIADLINTGGFSLTSYLRVNNFNTPNAKFIEYRHSHASRGDTFHLGLVENTGRIGFNSGKNKDGSSYDYMIPVGGYEIPLDTFIHLAFVVKAEEALLYINGILKYTFNRNPIYNMTNLYPDDGMRLYGFPSTDSDVVGSSYKSHHIYQVPLTPNQIINNYQYLKTHHGL